VIEDSKPLFGVRKSYAMPSVHATNFTAAIPIMATVFPAGAIPYAIYAGFVSFSRIYVGDHWPFDVLAGVALGLTLGFLGRKAFLRLGAKRQDVAMVSAVRDVAPAGARCGTGRRGGYRGSIRRSAQWRPVTPPSRRWENQRSG
jgi:membrane-associated phospholipid phosphatase